MIEIERRKQNGIFMMFDDASKIAGFMEQWYLGNYEISEGISVEKSEILRYSKIIANTEGIFIGKKHFCGFANQEKMYEEKSYLTNGSCVTYSIIKDEYISKYNSLKSLPKEMISIIAETEERILETAKILHLPLESRVQQK